MFGGGWGGFFFLGWLWGGEGGGLVWGWFFFFFFGGWGGWVGRGGFVVWKNQKTNGEAGSLCILRKQWKAQEIVRNCRRKRKGKCNGDKIERLTKSRGKGRGPVSALLWGKKQGRGV